MKKIFLLLFLVIWCYAKELEKVTLQLKWKHQFQFAGYYTALEKGYYKEVGLDVVIKEATSSTKIDVASEVLDKNAHFGVGMSNLLLEYAKGKPLVVLGVIFQHSPYSLMSLSNNINTIHDLIGKKVMIEEVAVDIFAQLRREKIDSDQLKIIEHIHNPSDLVDGTIDAMSVYNTNEPYQLYQKKIPYNLFSPREAGIDFYGDNLFTTQEMIENNPKLVEAFRQASFRGWQYALSHQEEVIQLILQKYNTQHKSQEYYQFEAKKLTELIHPDLIEIGYMHQGRWEHIVSVYQELGFLDKEVALQNFLYSSQKNFLQEYKTVLALLVGVIFLLGLSWYIVYKLKRKVQEVIKKNTEQSQKILMSNMIVNISHQWKEPLIQISALNHSLIHSCITANQLEKLSIIEKLYEIDKTVVFMSETMQNFLDFYKGSHKEEKFSIKDSIDSSLQIIGDKIKANNVQIIFKVPFDFSVVGKKNDFMQVWLNLINNSIDAGVKREKEILIQIVVRLDRVSFQDNCGGCENIEEIFSSQNNGLGLKMCQEIMKKNNFSFRLRNLPVGLQVHCIKQVDNPPLQY